MLKYTTAFFLLLLIFVAIYYFWIPGKDFHDGRHDKKRNGIWLQHGWLGSDHWFDKNMKTERKDYFRNSENMKELASVLRRHHITDAYPHLSPTSVEGEIPAVDSDQIKIFIEELDGLRIMPWVGGVAGKQAFPQNQQWRKNFAGSIRRLLTSYPKLKGIHINIEPCPSGSRSFLNLLDDVKKVLSQDQILSVAAYPPPTIWHPFKSVHWDKEYYKQVSQRANQIVVMMYDTALPFEKVYTNLISNWTEDVLDWVDGAEVLFGLPAYTDEWAGYHNPEVENLNNALHGVHAGLNRLNALPDHYQGIAIYSEWEMDNDEWAILKNHFLKSN